MTIRLLLPLLLALAKADLELPAGISPDKVQADYSHGRIIREGETLRDYSKPACEDMSSAACDKTPPKDPTGKVTPARVKDGIVAFVRKIAGNKAGSFVEDKITRVKLRRNYLESPDLLFNGGMSMSSDEETPLVSAGVV